MSAVAWRMGYHAPALMGHKPGTRRLMAQRHITIIFAINLRSFAQIMAKSFAFGLTELVAKGQTAKSKGMIGIDITM